MHYLNYKNQTPRLCHKYLTTSIICLMTTISFSLQASLFRDHQTTRLKATSGTGVASFLMDEATLLNPGALGLFTHSSIYYQQNKGEYQHENSDILDFKDKAFIASDSSGETGGSLSYTSQKIGNSQRKSFSASMARPFRDKSSLGLTYRRVNDKVDIPNLGILETNRYNQFSIGVIHAIHKNFSIGIVVENPFSSRHSDSLALVGFQYLFHDYITLMFDAGSDYTSDLSESSLYRGAIQIMFLNDFFIRAGFYQDNGLKEKGSSIGLSWVGPKLVIEFAKQNIDLDLNRQAWPEASKISESSFSIAYKF